MIHLLTQAGIHDTMYVHSYGKLMILTTGIIQDIGRLAHGNVGLQITWYDELSTRNVSYHNVSSMALY